MSENISSFPVLANRFKMDFQILEDGLAKVKWEIGYDIGGGTTTLDSDTMPIDVAMNGILYEVERMKKVVAEFIKKKKVNV